MTLLMLEKNHVNVKTPKSYITRMEFEKIWGSFLDMFDVILHMFLRLNDACPVMEITSDQWWSQLGYKSF